MTPAQRNKLADRFLPKVRAAVQAALIAEARAVARSKRPSTRRLYDVLLRAQRGIVFEMVKEAKRQTRLTISRMEKAMASELIAEFFLPHEVEDIEKWLKEVTAGSAQSTARKWRKRIAELEEEAKDEEITYAEIAARFEDEGIYDARWQAMRTARTDTIWSMNEGAEMAYKEAGVEAKEWDNSEDQDVCPFCDSLGGATVAIDDPFVPAGEPIEGTNDKGKPVTLVLDYDVMHPPLHPNCRCAEVPVV